MRRSTLAGAVIALLLFGPAAVRADDMDISLARLRVATSGGGALPAGCSATGENGSPRDYCADVDGWNGLVSELGGSMIPPVLSPARTVGYGGFYVGVEGWLTPISDAGRWHYGTEGDSTAGAESCGPNYGAGDLGCNRFPSRTLIWSRVSARKGFPFGFELGTHFASLLSTEYWAWGLEVKWALFEGFRSGIAGILPDIAVRGMVNTMVGEAEFNMTIPSVDIVISKPIAVLGAGTITPFVSGQLAWILADSELVDLTPEIDAFAECEPAPDSTMTTCTRSTAIPGGRMPGQDYNNNTTFPKVRATRTRLALGVQGRYEQITLSASFAFDLQEPSTGSDELTNNDLRRQIQVTAGAGLTF